jgi:hypothetical protein
MGHAGAVASHQGYGRGADAHDEVGPTQRVHTEYAAPSTRTRARGHTVANVVDSFRSRYAVRQRRLAALLPLESPKAEHEPEGELLGQCRRGVLLQQFEEGTDQQHIYKNRELALNDVADYINRFYNELAVTATLAA